MQEITSWLNFGASIILIIVTSIYVYLTKRILEETRRQSALSYTPVIGISIESIGVGEVFGPNRRNMSVTLSLTNVGNAPAIDVSVDGEILLEYSEIEGTKDIPSRFEPDIIPFISNGVTVEDSHGPSFGNTCVKHVLDDFRECKRLNQLRIETDASQKAYPTPRMNVTVYYRNALGQYFESYFEARLAFDTIPKDNEGTELRLFPRPMFHSGPIAEDLMKARVESRSQRRRFCGW